MFCRKCGFENPDDSVYCRRCGVKLDESVPGPEPAPGPAPGAPVPPAQPYAPAPAPVPVSAAGQKVFNALRDNLFLAICILISAAAGIGLFYSNFSVILILETIFLWLIFAAARKGYPDVKYLRCLSGTVFASFVVDIVIGSFIILLGILILFIFVITAGSISASVWSQIADQIGRFGALPDELSVLIARYFSIIFAVIPYVLIVIGGLIILFAILGTRSIHRFLQSVYMSVGSGNEQFVLIRRAKGWLMALGILGAIGAIPGFNIASLARSAALIIGSILIGRHFREER